MSVDTQNFKPLQVLSVKDISNIIGLSERTCKQYAKDIKEHFSIKKITFTHLQQYLKVQF
jgi:hypothetical protein